MSQVEINNNINSVNVQNVVNTVDVNQEIGNILVVPQEITTIIEIATPGPQGPPGDINSVTGSFVLTSSFNAFTASYNTASFTGSFIGEGSGLVNIVSASFASTASFALNFNPAATASYALQALTASYVDINTSQIAIGNITASVNADPNNLFLIKSGSTSYFNIASNSDTTFNSDLFIIKNFTTQENILTVSQSIIQFVTQSADPSGPALAGGFWFTSDALYVGID